MSSSNFALAFLVATPVVSNQSSHNFYAVDTHRNRCLPRRRALIRSCLPPQSTKDDTETNSNPTNISKTEKIAALLGQDRKEMEAEATAVKEEARKDNISKYGLALASVLLGTGMFLIQYLDPDRDVTIMKVLRRRSAPVEVIGTNNKPSLIEFSASWCDNCRAMARGVFDLELDFADKVNFVVIDGDDPQRRDVIDQYGVDAIPQFSMIDKKGEVVGNLIGFVPKESLKKDLEALLQDKPLPFPGFSLDELVGPLSSE